MATTTWPRTLPRVVQRSRCTRLLARPITTAAVVHDLHNAEPHIGPPSPSLTPRHDSREKLRHAKPFSEFLTDNFNRQHDYLRISLTERCNLRCTYCMPSEGIELSPDRDILTTPEIYYLSALFVNQGVNKIRLTGGEPTVRKDIVPLMQQIGRLRRHGLKELAITTNGISLHRKLDEMVEAGLTGVNISLDTLDPLQFPLLTRRNGFNAVMKSINRVQELNKLGAGMKLKINCVAMRGINDDQILKFVEMTREQDLEVRFIEYMPFGGNKWAKQKMLPYMEMVELIQTRFPTLARLQDAKNDTSKTWQVPGFKGRVGFITSMTHNFCGTCNRLRITSDGNLKVCLHGNAEVSLRDLLRADNSGNPMDEQAFEAVRQIELGRSRNPSALVGASNEEGWISKERQLLEVIGAAVKRKAAKHADMGDLENMKNRPMILIGKSDVPHVPCNPPQATSLRHGKRTSWSRVPLHMLSSSPTTSQLRLYSSSSDKSTDKTIADGKPEIEPATRLATAFGFQSLSGLFEQPTRGWYSTHREQAGAVEAMEKPESPPAQGHTPLDTAGALSHTHESVLKRTGESKTDSAQSAAVATTKSSDAKQQQSAAAQHVNASSSSDAGTADSTTTSIGTQRERTFAEIGDAFRKRFAVNRVLTPSAKDHVLQNDTIRMTARRQRGVGKTVLAANMATEPRSRRRVNPFSVDQGSRVPKTHDNREGTTSAAAAPAASKPWGPPHADEKNRATGLDTEATIDERDAATGCSTGTATSVAKTTKKTRRKGPSSVAQSSTEKVSSEDSVASGVAAGHSSSPNNLTHVTSSGEAHMVDVGEKQNTKRVAIAVSVLQFNNDEPYRLISENINKKGDVLGVARVAGIMAAKRTSGLIPLCHPIAVTKVEIDMRLTEPQGIAARKFGNLMIQARVDCTGPTGVEMEALTSATVAALTVYDMCKAVDKDMVITSSRVTYKSGGRSGTYASRRWAKAMGPSWFVEQGLDIPKAATNDAISPIPVEQTTHQDSVDSSLCESVPAPGDRSSAPPSQEAREKPATHDDTAPEALKTFRFYHSSAPSTDPFP